MRSLFLIFIGCNCRLEYKNRYPVKKFTFWLQLTRIALPTKEWLQFIKGGKMPTRHEFHIDTPPKPPLAGLRRFISSVRLFPKTHDFFQYFQKSAENIVEGTGLLCKMIAHTGDRRELLGQLKEIEQKGDQITHEVIDLLHKTFLTPFDRTDIYTLIVKMDDVLDFAYFVGNRMTRYDVKEMPEEVPQMADIVHHGALAIKEALLKLKDLKNSQNVLKYCIEINRLENEADEKMNHAIENLFKNDWDPYEVIKLKEILENLEGCADVCEDVANAIESIILRNA